jgi:hypothetical protein
MTIRKPTFSGVTFLLPLLLWALGAQAQERATSQWVSIGPDGKLAYKTTPAGDRIMDFSYAGYMGGGVAIPRIPVKTVIKPSGADDDTAAIQSAIDEVAKLPLEGGFRGAVQLSPGTYPCAQTITLSASGVVLRGSGQSGPEASTIKLVGKPHLAIAVRGGGDPANRRGNSEQPGDIATTTIADAYVPAGAMSFTVADGRGLASGDTIVIRKPVTAAWVKFMGMDDMTRDGKPQTWIKTGSNISTERRIAAIDGRRITLDVPLSDSLDARYLSPPGVIVAKINPPARLSQVGIENLHIESPAQEINHTQPHFTALRLTGEDCWARDLTIDETMNSVAVGGRRVTLQRVIVNRKAKHQGSSKPAEFAPNGSQVLLDRCAVNADNVWFIATGAGVSGPVVILNCTFTGDGRAESHQRWSTGLLYDNCRAQGGGLEFRNRGSMGSGHGWSMGWGVMWNCVAKDYVVQNPPGAMNWMIGCIGENKAMPRPFSQGPLLPKGTEDSPAVPVQPHSLYVAQLAERVGSAAIKNVQN